MQSGYGAPRWPIGRRGCRHVQCDFLSGVGVRHTKVRFDGKSSLYVLESSIHKDDKADNHTQFKLSTHYMRDIGRLEILASVKGGLVKIGRHLRL